MRLEICKSCTFYKKKCTFCGCSGKGVIEDPSSRCPRNLWPDGWGVSSMIIPEYSDEIDITVWDGERIVSKKEIEMEMKDWEEYPCEDNKRYLKIKHLIPFLRGK